MLTPFDKSSERPNLWENQSVLVTGCRGFIGGALAQRLTMLGAHLILPVRPKSSLPEIFTNSQQTVVSRLPLSDVPAVEQAIRRYNVKTVFHMAANTENRGNKRSPLAIFEDNIRATYSILEASRLSQVDRVILASSQDFDRQLNESGAKMHPYGASKGSVEFVARSYVETYGLPVIVIKPDNVYGPGDHNFGHLIPSAVRDLLRRKTFRLSGNPNTKRGFIYIEDLIDALLIVGNNRTQFIRSDFITNLNAGELHRIGDIVNLLKTLANAENKTPGDKVIIPREICPKILKISDWQATVSLDQGLPHTIEYYRNKLTTN